MALVSCSQTLEASLALNCVMDRLTISNSANGCSQNILFMHSHPVQAMHYYMTHSVFQWHNHKMTINFSPILSSL